MSRSGYSDECEGVQLWRGAVHRAINGRRGQAFLGDLLAALDALPNKRLIAHELENGAEVCALGSVGRLRGMDMTGLDPEAHHKLGEAFGIAPCMVQEIEFENDDDFAFSYSANETPEQRFMRVRAWVVEHLRPDRLPQGIGP